MQHIYFDNAASTPVDPRVLDAMLPYFTDRCGNASSLHRAGVEAKEALDAARTALARSINAAPDEIVFTSSGTESNNLALKGFAFANRHRGRHVVVSAIEHDCVINSCKWLQSQGFAVTVVPVDEEGLVDMNRLAAALQPETIMVSVMHANNEIGVVQPIGEMGALCRARGIAFHTDACQSFGKLPLDVRAMALDMATINAHKMHGPKGVGALFIRSGTAIMPWQHGGGHEFGLRSATENIPGIVGFATAATLAMAEREQEMNRLQTLRDKVIDTVLAAYPAAYLNGHRHHRLPTNINLGFAGLEGDATSLLAALDEEGICVSTGSACSSNRKTSHVLAAIGRNPLQAIGAVRITFGRFTTAADVERFLDVLPKALGGLRSIWSGPSAIIVHADIAVAL